MGAPARGYSWPTATVDNEISLKHGTHSPRRFLPMAKVIAEQLMAELPNPTTADALAVEEIAITRAKKRLVDEWLDEREQIDDKDQVRSVADYAIRLGRLVKEQEASLWRRRAEREKAIAGGVDPVAALAAEGRRIMAAQNGASGE